MPLTDAIVQTLADGACMDGPRSMADVNVVAQPGQTLGEFAKHCHENSVPGSGAFALFVLQEYEVTDRPLRNEALRVLIQSPFECWHAVKNYQESPNDGSWKLMRPIQRQAILNRALDLLEEIQAGRLDAKRRRMLERLGDLTPEQRAALHARRNDP